MSFLPQEPAQCLPAPQGLAISEFPGQQRLTPSRLLSKGSAALSNKVLPFGGGGKPWGMATACVVFSTSGASLTSGRYLVAGTGMCSDKIPLRA